MVFGKDEQNLHMDVYSAKILKMAMFMFKINTVFPRTISPPFSKFWTHVALKLKHVEPYIFTRIFFNKSTLKCLKPILIHSVLRIFKNLRKGEKLCEGIRYLKIFCWIKNKNERSVLNMKIKFTYQNFHLSFHHTN